MFRPIQQRGIIADPPVTYGYSVYGNPLQIWLPEKRRVELLVFAGIHGEEPDSIVLLSRALRSMQQPLSGCAVILCANPDGVQLGTRGNANGIDLNRNFPSRNWQTDGVSHSWNFACEERVVLSPGSYPGSEPETTALLKVIERLKPETVVSIHSPLGLIDDPGNTALGTTLAKRTGLPHEVLPNESTPGSFGSWSADNGLSTITYELPNQSIWEMVPTQLPVLEDLLQHGLAISENTAAA